jgi:hypothetical protein
VAGLLNKNEFKQGLRAGLDEGGVGLSQVSARKLTLYFEKIIIQGLETKGHGH